MTTTIYYVCPKDRTYSGEMPLVKKETKLSLLEIRKVADHIIGERLKCPLCNQVYGWHELKKIEKKEGK